MAYTKTPWVDNTSPYLEAANLNHAEQGIFDAAATADAARAGSTATVKALADSNITLSGTQTIDGVSCGVGDRVAPVGQTSASQNGVYVVASGAWSRASDFASASQFIAGTLVSVQQGTQHATDVWMFETTGSITLGTTPLVYGRLLEGAGFYYGWVNTIAELKAVTGVVNTQLYQVAGYYAANDGGGGRFRYNSSSTATDNGGTIIAPNSGSGRWERVAEGTATGRVNVKWFGAYGNGANDDSTAVTNALAWVQTGSSLAQRVVYFPAGRYNIVTTLQVSANNIAFEGDQWGRYSLAASWIDHYGANPFIQKGTDNGHAYDAADYDGPEGLTLRNLYIRQGDASTALDSAQGNYTVGSYGIRDWRGGDIRLDNVVFENFNYGFWGIQSDFNQFNKVRVRYCHRGFWLGPRSDQNSFYDLEADINDEAVEINGASHTRFTGCNFIANGITTTAFPVKIKSDYSFGACATAFHGCWFEHFTGATEIEAFVDIATGDTQTTTDVTFRDCLVASNAQGVSYHAKYFLRIGNAERTTVDGLTGGQTSSGILNLIALISYTGTNLAETRLVMKTNIPGQNSLYVNNGSGEKSVSVWQWGSSSNTISGTNGRLALTSVPSNSQRNFYFTSFADQELDIVFPDTGEATLRMVSFARRRGYGSVAPTSGTYAQGDMVFSSAPVAGGPLGWVCVVAGTPGTWLPFSNLNTAASSITGAQTVANTVTETVLGSITLAANELAAGSTLHITGDGTCGITASQPTLTFRVRIGSAVLGGNIATSLAVTPAASATSTGTWHLDALVTVRTAGSGGTIIGNGSFLNNLGTTPAITNVMSGTAATVAVDTTASRLLGLTFQWGTANASNTLTCHNLLINIPKP